jgi:hypothetical protein
MISDGVVIGIVLGLIFAAVSYYLYSRIGQLERKVGLMENILLDLKVTTEQTLMSVTEVDQQPPTRSSYTTTYDDADEAEGEAEGEESRNVVVEGATPRKAPSSSVSVEREKPSVSVNYESMTYKELVQLARQKGITGVRNSSKAQVIDMLRRHDSGDSEETPFVEEEGTNISDLLSAQPTQGSSLDDSEVDGSLVQ